MASPQEMYGKTYNLLNSPALAPAEEFFSNCLWLLFYDEVTFVSFYWKFLMKNGLDSEHESIYHNTFPPILYKFYVAHTYVTQHEKTGIMYTKYIYSYYGTYLLYCKNISKSSGKLD